MKIYVASSWRNQYQPEVVRMLRNAGHEVYDFRNPPNGSGGFSWSDIDPDWENWTTEQYFNALQSPMAYNGSRLCAVWEIKKQMLNYAEKFI